MLGDIPAAPESTIDPGRPMTEHKWGDLFVDFSDDNDTPTNRYQVCVCGAKRRVIAGGDGTSRVKRFVWICGPYEHPQLVPE